MESPLPPDPYKALDVPKDASLATIRSAHRKLVLKTHPDKVQGDEVLKKKRAEEFHTIQQSYEILSDDVKRKAYDDRVRLAALRAEMMAERPSAKITSDIRPMNGRSPVVEVRGGRVYEERVPRTTSWDGPADDFFNHKARDSRPKYDDIYTPSTSRKTSARLQEEKMRARDLEEEQERLRWERSYVKAEKKSVFAERDRKRTTTRKKDYDSKYDSRHRGPYVEDDSETSSGSSDTEFTYRSKRREEPPRHRYEEVRRKDREELPRRDSKRLVEDLYPPSHEVKANTAAEYIRQAREPEVDSRRPSMYKGASTRDIRPTPPPVSTSDHPRRSSGRPPLRRESSPPPKLSAKNRRVTEIVDPPDTRRMPVSSSDPNGLRGMVREKPIRSSTAADRYTEPKSPSPRIMRAETMPIHRSRHDDQYTKSSRSKEVDAGYSSPESPPAISPKKTSTKIFVVEEDQEAVPRNYNNVYLTPEDKYRRDREQDHSPPPSRKPAERPSMSSRAGTSSRMPSGRKPSYAVDAEDFRAPKLKRSETERPPMPSSRQSTSNSPRQYFGEIPKTEEPYKIIHHSPKPGPNDIRYARYDRRGSEDASPDWAPGSNFDPRSRPSHHRSTTSRVY
ncbi:MAG: hypothetical protein Q9169_005500 [Polycauliona sp. 2 TL-2023]